jgi:multiple sugar transport system ATP-binding protein
VFDNIAFPLRAQRVPSAEVDQRVLAIARILRMEGLLKRRIKQLSSGEQQRVALGRAMIRRPQVLLMDEPLTNLDAKLRSEMRAELKHLQREQNVTTIYVTHDQVEAMALGDRITVMSNGKIQQVGAPMDVYRHPANLYVAGFLGTPPMSLVPCELSRAGGQLLASRGDFVVRLLAATAAAVQERGLTNVVVGLRPESVVVSLQEPQSATQNDDLGPACPADVYAVEPLGDENIVDVRIVSTHGGVPATVLARTSPAVRPRVAQRVWISAVTTGVHVFDPTTEESIRAGEGIEHSQRQEPVQSAG